MCGRFVRSSPVEKIAERFDVDEPPFDLRPSYNVAPGEEIAVVTNGALRRLTLCRWGFVPPWAKEPSAGYKMINARAETLSEKPSFRDAFRRNRCLIVADGFYEWRKEGDRKLPEYIHLKEGGPFAFAALCGPWTPPGGTEILTAAIITTAANEILMPIHHRMPVILPVEAEDIWLNPDVDDEERLLSILAPYPPDRMAHHPVSESVNKPSNDSPDCIKPL